MMYGWWGLGTTFGALHRLLLAYMMYRCLTLRELILSTAQGKSGQSQRPVRELTSVCELLRVLFIDTQQI